MVDNTVTIVGNLTADPEVRVTDGGATLAEIRIAQNKRKRNSDGSWETQDGQNRSVVDISIDEIAPSLRWAKANLERSSGGMSSSPQPVARENYEEDEAPF